MVLRSAVDQLLGGVGDAQVNRVALDVQVEVGFKHVLFGEMGSYKVFGD